MEECHQYWGIHAQPCTYAYNNQEHCSTNLPPLSLELWQQPIRHNTFDDWTALPTDATANTVPPILWARQLNRLTAIRQDTDKQMKIAHCRYKDYYDRKDRNALLSITTNSMYTSIGRHYPPRPQSEWRWSRKTNFCPVRWFHSE